MIDQEEKKPDEEEKKEEPAVLRKPVGVPTMLGGLGGTNMMAELKAKQEKRKSQVKLYITLKAPKKQKTRLCLQKFKKVPSKLYHVENLKLRRQAM